MEHLFGGSRREKKDKTIERTSKERGFAYALSKYLRYRSEEKLAPEFTIGGLVVGKEQAAMSPLSAKKIRQQGRSWCPFLGHDTSIKDDQLLTAYFAANASKDGENERDIWGRLYREFKREGRYKTVQKWRSEGAALIDRATRENAPKMSDGEGSLAYVNPIFLKKGTGSNSLRSKK
ncbi:hypothetical protein [Pseudochrobactrum sp. XF203]|uniref:hypothetical protein n=1 Tax=Pseudochrobactrum sp. XF203 TaxID=2879116 RepID=UPI001CE2C31E|nr:hypothetical protein [Pseudochrobactrum sp. XF203]UCA44758.1 hypothetical protein LDL70_10250 [Pseudochrobactrum sp. XF203]